MVNGNNKEDLIKVLTTINNTTTIDNAILQDQEIVVKAKRYGNKIESWELSVDKDVYKSNPKKIFGKGIKELKEALNTLDSLDACSGIDVLVHCETDIKRNYDGKIVSTWFKLFSGDPYTITNKKQINIPTITLYLDEGDYKILMETKIAFMDESISGKRTIYAIRESAMASIGKLMDCAASFKYMAHIPLGSGMLLTERLGNLKKINLICRNHHELENGTTIKSLIGVAGDRHKPISQLDFFEDVHKGLIKRIGLMDCDVIQWSVSDELTTVEYSVGKEYSLGGSYSFDAIVKVQISDIPGTSVKMFAYADMGKGRVLLKKNSSYHNNNFDLESLNEGIIESFNEFEAALNENKVDTYAKKEDLKEIFSIIGKKRTEASIDDVDKLFKESLNTGSVALVLESIIDRTYHKLPVKQADELAIAYDNLSKVLINRTRNIAS